MNQLTDLEIAWLAGFMEGEGYFAITTQGYPKIQCASTDEDTLWKLYELLGVGTLNVHNEAGYRSQNRRACYILDVVGSQAVPVMEAILPYMCSRRADKIRGIIERERGRVYKKRKPSPIMTRQQWLQKIGLDKAA